MLGVLPFQLEQGSGCMMSAAKLFAVFVLFPLGVSGLSIVIDHPCDKAVREGLQCSPSEVCRLVQVQCFATPCYLQTQCVPANSPNASCPFGDDGVLDTGGKLLSCSPCPSNSTCRNGVCCWEPVLPDIDPCIYTLCPVNSVCESRIPKGCADAENCQKEAYCKPIQRPCEITKCERGYHCIEAQPGCLESTPPELCVPFAVCIEDKSGFCPSSSGPRLCAQTCSVDSNCGGNQKCCSGCCTDPVEPIPYPCIYSKCSIDYECRLQVAPCKALTCPVGPNCVPKPKCPVGSPLVDGNSTEINCSRGAPPNACPSGSYCEVHPADQYAVCCRNVTAESKCPVGLPVVDFRNEELFCGEGPNSVQCPDSTYCETSHGVCCHQSKPEPFDPCIATTCLEGFTCEARTPVNCFPGSPCQAVGVCIPPPNYDPCKAQECKPDERCEVLYPPCAPSDPPRPCVPVANCRKTTKDGECPSLPYDPTCTKNCSVDIDCTGDLKCCKNGCGKLCVEPKAKTCETMICPEDTECILKDVVCVQAPCDPQPVCVQKRNGMCPDSGNLIGPCVNLCESDEDCKGTAKCCKYGCGKTCQTAIATYVASDPCSKRTCKNKVCRLKKVRCFQGECLRAVCVDKSAITSSKLCKSGYPVIVRKRKEVSCNGTQTCPDNTVCTDGVCCWDSDIQLKDGTCPRNPSLLDNCNSQCSNDGNCPGRQKCCNAGCSRTCQDPLASYDSSDPCSQKKCRRKQVCVLRESCKGGIPCKPVARCVAETAVSLPSSCESGYPVQDQSRKQICCFGSSGLCPQNTVCSGDVCCWNTGPPVTPPKEKVGSCPPPPPFGTCDERCPNDGFCTGTQKCCSHGCGHSCQNSVMVTYLPSDPCSKKKCPSGKVCRLRSRRCRSASCLPVRPVCVSEIYGPRSCVSGYPVQERRTQRPICCLKSADACPEKTVCMNGVCCWDRANDWLKG